MAPVICITGGTGFIGSHLARALPGAHLFDYPQQDLRIREHACNFIDRWQPDVVFHLAAQSVVTNDHDLDSLSTNIDGTYNLLHACRRIRNLKSIVHISTDKVYGNNDYAKTNSQLKGVDHPYSASKLCGDVIAQMYKEFYGLPVHIVRTGNIYGEGDTHFDRIIPGTIWSTLHGRAIELRSDGRFVRDFIYVGDLIPAYLRIAAEPPGIYNLGGESWMVLDVVKNILDLMNSDLKPVIVNNQRNEIPIQHVVDSPNWWDPKTQLRDGLRKAIAWYTSQA